MDPKYSEILDLPVRSGSTLLVSLLHMVDASSHKSMQNFSVCKELKYSVLHNKYYPRKIHLLIYSVFGY